MESVAGSNSLGHCKFSCAHARFHLPFVETFSAPVYNIFTHLFTQTKNSGDSEHVLVSSLLHAQCYFELFVGKSSSRHWESSCVHVFGRVTLA